MMFKLATWNVNSLKVRLPQVLDWLELSQTDALALQETKLEDAAFPKEAFESAGYEVMFRGQKTYNGVAWITRHHMTDAVDAFSGYLDEQKRILAVTINQMRLINVYIPNGQSKDSPKYLYKMEWLDAFTAFVRQEMQKYSKVAIVGDFNIAPEDIDVYDPKMWYGQVLVSEPERQAFSQLQRLGLVDIVRLQHLHDENLYSWWDYRAAAFRRGMGLRIDHVLLSDPLVEKCMGSGIDKEPRKNERPSDHTPVWVTLTNE